jgi:DNA-binding MarR family transcriptional regulator
MPARVSKLLSYRLARLANLNDRAGHAHLKEAFGLTLGEWRVLGNIAERDNATFTDIAGAMTIDKGQLSRTVTTLVERGLVASASSPGNRRGVILSLTPQGAKFHERVLAFAHERNAALISCLEPHEMRALDTILRKLTTYVEIEHAALAHGHAWEAENKARKATLRRKTA